MIGDPVTGRDNMGDIMAVRGTLPRYYSKGHFDL